MRRYSRAIGVAVAAVLTCGLGGCVDQEASLGIRGVVEFSGTRSTEEVECGGGGGGMMNGMDGGKTKNKTVLSCQKTVEAGSVESFLGGATIDVSDYTQRGGQVGPSGGFVSDEEFCKMDPQKYFQLQYRHPQFLLTLDTENRLQDSREVGAEGQGGGGGGFEGLELNQNDIHLKKLRVRFPNASVSELERTIQLSTLAESGGGGAAITFSLVDSGDIQSLQKVHQRLVKQRAGLNTYNDRAKKTSVTVVSEFVLEGETLGGNEVTSNKFSFPIRICGTGCGTTPVCNFQSEGGG